MCDPRNASVLVRLKPWSYLRDCSLQHRFLFDDVFFIAEIATSGCKVAYNWAQILILLSHHFFLGGGEGPKFITQFYKFRSPSNVSKFGDD